MHKLGEIWKSGCWWKIKLPHGIESFRTKAMCFKYRAIFWSSDIQKNYKR